MNEQEMIKDIEIKTNQYQIANDIEFNKNKKNINIILRGDTKYYYANQCALFTKNLLLYGIGNISKDQIKKEGVCFNKYSINNGYNQYCRDIKRFNNKEEMLGFVIGYNEALYNLEYNKQNDTLFDKYYQEYIGKGLTPSEAERVAKQKLKLVGK